MASGKFLRFYVYALHHLPTFSRFPTNHESLIK